MKSSLLSSLKLRAVLGSSFAVILLLICLHHASGQENANQNVNANTVVGSVFVDASKPPVQPMPPPSPPAETAIRGTTSWKNEWWWLDILSDGEGVSFHRFQMAAWTLVLGIIFVVQVYSALAMPDFNGSLLALLGISAGTFLGVKIPEPTAPKK